MSDLLRRINEERNQRVQDLHLNLPVPTWDGGLVARMEILPRKEVEKFGKVKRDTDSDCSFIARSVAALYLLDPNHEAEGTRMEENDQYVRIEDENGLPVKFDKTLADKLGLPGVASAKDVILYCFKDNAIAVGGFAVRIIQWMQNTDAEVAEAIVGES